VLHRGYTLAGRASAATGAVWRWCGQCRLETRAPDAYLCGPVDPLAICRGRGRAGARPLTGGRSLDGSAGWPRRRHSAVPQGEGRLLVLGPEPSAHRHARRGSTCRARSAAVGPRRWPRLRLHCVGASSILVPISPPTAHPLSSLGNTTTECGAPPILPRHTTWFLRDYLTFATLSKRTGRTHMRGVPRWSSVPRLARLPVTRSAGFRNRCSCCTSRLVDDWFHARSRRASPLHRWLMDGAAAAELPARSSIPAGRDACRAPAVLMPWRAHDMDVPSMRCGRVRAAATYRLPRPRRPGRGALRRSSSSSRRSSSSASATSIDGSGPPRSRAARRKSRHQSQL
jgi:hypothetical protein